MAETLSKRITIHTILRSSRFIRIKELPEGHRAALQHAAPVFMERLPNPVQIAQLAKRIQLKEFEVRRRDLRHIFIIQHILTNLFLLLLIREVKQYCENIGMPRHLSLA